MPRYIVKLCDKYVEYSTIVDAFVTRPMTLAQFKAYYYIEYGASAMPALDGRLARVENYGTSDPEPTSADKMLRFNRLGPHESCLYMEQVEALVRDLALPEDYDVTSGELALHL